MPKGNSKQTKQSMRWSWTVNQNLHQPYAWEKMILEVIKLKYKWFSMVTKIITSSETLYVHVSTITIKITEEI